MFYNKLLSSRAKIFEVSEETIEIMAKRLKGFYQAEKSKKVGKKITISEIARGTGLDRKTVRKYS